MVGSMQNLANLAAPFLVPAGEDRFGKYQILGISHVAFKIALQDNADVSISVRNGMGRPTFEDRLEKVLNPFLFE